MATPPPVSREDVAAAITRITRRHQQTDNPAQHLLTDDPRDVLSYLRRCGARRLLENAESHDLEDAVVLRLFLWWEGEQTELWILDAVETLRFPRRRIRTRLGIATNEGLHDRHDRKRALLGPAGVPSEKLTRAERKGSRPAEQVAAGPGLREVYAELLALRRHFPLDVDEGLGALRAEAGPRAELTDQQLALELRFLIEDVDVADLPCGAAQSVRKALDLTVPPSS